jgi:hypothetical protein
MKMEQTECSKTSAYKIQTPGNYPEESKQHSEHGESLKSRILHSSFRNTVWTLYYTTKGNHGSPFAENKLLRPGEFYLYSELSVPEYVIKF